MKIFKIVIYLCTFIYLQNISAYAHGIDNYYPEDVYVKILYRLHPDSDWIYVPANAKDRGLQSKSSICVLGIEVVTAKNYHARNFTLLGSLKLSGSLLKSLHSNVILDKNGNMQPAHSTNIVDPSYVCRNTNWVISAQGRVGLWHNNGLIVQ